MYSTCVTVQSMQIVIITRLCSSCALCYLLPETGLTCHCAIPQRIILVGMYHSEYMNIDPQSAEVGSNMTLTVIQILYFHSQVTLFNF